MKVNHTSHGESNSKAQTVYAGIDISKNWLDLYIADKSIRFNNTSKQIDAIIKLVKQQDADTIVVFESTGYLSKPLIARFSEKGVAFKCINPTMVKYFAKGRGVKAKTDKIDAALLAEFGQANQLSADMPSSKEMLTLKELQHAQASLIEKRATYKTEIHAYCEKQIIKMYEGLIKALTKEINKLEKMIMKLIEADELMKFKFDILSKIEGVGQRTAQTMVILMPELGLMNRSKISSLVGVAPYARDSGNKRGERHIQGGRKEVRNMLFMSVTASLQYNEVIRAFYYNLKKRGKSDKQSRIACCRKMVTYMNSLIRKNLPDATSHVAEGRGGE